jgi:hypothetical protein
MKSREKRRESRVSRQKRLLLPKSLSYLTPIQIAQHIKLHVKTIEGPVSVSLLIPNDTLKEDLGRDGPVIILLGDIHVGEQKCANCRIKDGCYSLYNESDNGTSTLMNWIDRFSRRFKVSTDFFIENWVDVSLRGQHEGLWADHVDGSALPEIAYLSAPCTTKQRTNCPFPHIRTHFTDIRHNYDTYKADNLNILRSYLLRTNTLPDLTSQFPLVRKFARDNLKEYLEFRFPDFSFESILQSYIDVLSFQRKHFFDNPFFQRHSRAYHEWIQLPEKVRNEIRTSILFYGFTDDEEHAQMEENMPKLITFLSQLRNGSFTEKDRTRARTTSSKDMFNLLTLLVDNPFSSFCIELYTICRMLKDFEKGLPSQLSVVYEGVFHTRNILFTLKNYYTTNVYATDVSKCIHLH